MLIGSTTEPQLRNKPSSVIAGQRSKQRSVNKSSYMVALLPWLALLAFCVLLHGGGAEVDAGEGREVSIFRQLGYGTTYLFALCVALRNPRQLLTFVLSVWPFLILILYAAISVIWSAYPVKVAITVLHYIGVFITAATAALATRADRRNLVTPLTFILLGILFLSAITAILVPAIGVIEGGRWRGLTVHPNTLGAVALIAVWAAITLVATTKKQSDRLLAAVTIICAFVCVIGANSVTSTVLSVWVVGAVMALSVLIKFGIRAPLALFGLVLYLSGGIAAAIALMKPELMTVDGVFQLLGRERNFTGRVDIWTQGIQLFHLRPWTGWSFDDLLTARAYSGKDLPVQFHNGYIHAIAMGGIAGCLMLTVMLVHACMGLYRAFRRDPIWAASVTALIVVVMVHNVTEASFLRATNFIWVVLLSAYFWLVSEFSLTVRNSPNPEISRRPR